jgi:hypothetical protein
MNLKGCQEGKATPKMVEIKCPECGDIIEVFVRMGGTIPDASRMKPLIFKGFFFFIPKDMFTFVYF